MDQDLSLSRKFEKDNIQLQVERKVTPFQALYM